MTTPACFSYTIQQGATFDEGFRYCSAAYPVKRNSCGKLVRVDNGAPVPDSELTPIDLTDCTARMQLRSEVTDPHVLLELTTSNGRINLNQGDGWVKFKLTDEETRDIPFGDSPPITWHRAIGQLDIEFPNGDVFRAAEVSWRVSPGGNR